MRDLNLEFKIQLLEVKGSCIIVRICISYTFCTVMISYFNAPEALNIVVKSDKTKLP